MTATVDTAEALAWHPHPEAWALCLGLLVAYFGAIRRYGPLMHPRPGERGASAGQQVAFVLGVVLLWVTSASPLHDVGEEYLFSAHMIQHLIDVFGVPALLLLGMPGWMFELLVRGPRARAVVGWLSRPLVAGGLFNLLLLLIHWPAVVDWMVTHEGFHVGSHLLLVASAFLMWLPVLSPSSAVAPRVSPPVQMAYLFMMTILPTVPASFLTFGEQPLYAIYETVPRLWNVSPLDDMQVAGLIMKIGGGFFLWIVITILFFRWVGREEAEGRGRTGTPVVAAAHPTDHRS